MAQRSVLVGGVLTGKQGFKLGMESLRPTLRRVVFALAVSSLVVACSGTKTNPIAVEQASPAWFGAIAAMPGQIVGYGIAASAASAKANALREISEQISVNVQSKTHAQIEDVAGDVLDYSRHEVSITSNQRISRAQQLNYRHINGRHYIAWMVDMRPTIHILAERLISANGGKFGALTWQGNSTLAQGPFIKKLTTLITEKGQAAASLPLSLHRTQQQWQLSVGDAEPQIIDEAMLVDLFDWRFKHNDDYTLAAINSHNSPTKRLSAGERFNLAATAVQPEGYFSLFNLYSDGRVALLQDNKPSKRTQLLGDDQGPFQLEAQPLDPQRTDYDTYIGLWSKKKLDNTRFPFQSEEIMSSDQASYKLPELLKQIESSKTIAIATTVIEITP